jgi:hypothetical protein
METWKVDSRTYFATPVNPSDEELDESTEFIVSLNLGNPKDDDSEVNKKNRPEGCATISAKCCLP